MSTINAGDFAISMDRIIREYTDQVSEGIYDETESVAKKVLREVKSRAPKLTGSYAKGFKITNKSLKTYGYAKFVVWNKKHYKLVHLLELGHAKRGGGRVRAYPHLRPAYDKYAAELVDSIKNIIQNGGR